MIPNRCIKFIDTKVHCLYLIQLIYEVMWNRKMRRRNIQDKRYSGTKSFKKSRYMTDSVDSWRRI